MAGFGCGWTKSLAAAVLLLGAGRVGFAQSPRGAPAAEEPVPRASAAPAAVQSAFSGTLVGKLTDLYSKPLEGVTVVVRNQATGAEARATTRKNGAYRFNGLEPGMYTVEAESPQLGRGQVGDIAVNAGAEAHVQTAIQFTPFETGPVLAAASGANRPQWSQPHGSQPAPEPVPPLASQTALAAEPIETLWMPGRPVSAGGEIPAATAAQATASAAAKPLQAQALAGQSRKVSLPSTVAIATAAAPAPAPANAPSAAGGSLRASAASPARTGSKVAAQAAVGAIHAAQRSIRPAAEAGGVEQAEGGAASGQIRNRIRAAAAQTAEAEPAQPSPNPVLAASQRSSPAAQAPAAQAPAAQAPAAQTMTGTISARQLEALPVSGRHWQDFVLDNAPTSVAPAGGQGRISLRGAGLQPAAIAVDGVNMGLAFGPTGGSTERSSGRGALGESGADPAGMARVGMGGHGLALSESAIRTVQTEAGNVEARAGWAAGGRMEVKTRSGGNELHGQGFLFDRGRIFSAQNPFSQWVTETAPAVLAYNPSGPPLSVPIFDNGPNGPPESYTPPDRETTWGIGMGSRIGRKNLFWFAALGNSYRNDPGLAMVKHPYFEEPQSNCQPGSPCPPTSTGFFANPTSDELDVLCARLGLTEPGQTEACTNPLVQALVPYSQMLENLAGLLGPAPRTAKQWTGFGRIDWKATERQSFTLEGIGATWNSPGGGLTSLSEDYGNHSFGSTHATEEWLLGRWEAFLTPNLLAVTQLSAGRAMQQARPSTPSAFEQTFLQGNAWGQLPQIVVDNRYGFTIGNPSRFGKGSYPDERVYQEQEQLDWAHGKLLVKAGFQASHNADATSLLRNQTGTYTYSDVENFISDALAFQNYGISGELSPAPQHACDQTGTVWTDSGGNVRGLGDLPCYSSYSQTIGPSDWHVSTNDWAGYVSAQWQAGKFAVASAGLRWEREQLPPPIAALNNPQLPLTEKLPSLGNDWGPRLSLAVGSGQGRWPVLRLGYGMYYGRTTNLTVEKALTQTGSLNGDLNFFMRPTDDLPGNGGGAPPFPYVPRPPGPGSVIKPGVVEFAPRFRNPEVHQAVASVEKILPGHVEVTASAMLSLGRRLPISIDTNLDSPTSLQTITYNVVDPTGAGPIKASQITVPFYASWPAGESACPSTPNLYVPGRPNPCYQQITNIESRANSTYEAGMLRLGRMACERRDSCPNAARALLELPSASRHAARGGRGTVSS